MQLYGTDYRFVKAIHVPVSLQINATPKFRDRFLLYFDVNSSLYKIEIQFQNGRDLRKKNSPLSRRKIIRAVLFEYWEAANFRFPLSSNAMKRLIAAVYSEFDDSGCLFGIQLLNRERIAKFRTIDNSSKMENILN